MMRARGWLALVITIAARPALAQSSISGSAEVTAVQASSVTDDHDNHNSSLWQNYTAGLHSHLWDPRLLKYDGEVTFRTNSLSSISPDAFNQYGRQRDLGFRANVAALSDGAFPLYAQVSRSLAGSTGELALSNPLRGGLGLLNSTAAFETEQRNITVGGLLNLAGLPRAEVSYRRGDDTVVGGADRSRQRQDDLTANVVRETSGTRHALHYQRIGYAYELLQTFSQQSASVDYDVSSRLRPHLQFTARAGQRRNEAWSALIAPPDPADQPYAPPPIDGVSTTAYANTGVSFDPSRRFSARLDATWDRQQTADDAVQAGLGSASVHMEIVRGLSFDAAASGGRREQIIDTRLTQVVTTNGLGGLTYSGGPRWFNVTLRANRGRGVNVTPEGERGATSSATHEANVSSAIAWFGISGGYERLSNVDAIVDYGNFDSERYRGSVTAQSSRVQLTAGVDDVQVTRGFGATFVANRQQSFSGSIAMRLWREVQLSALAGGFTTAFDGVAGHGLDRAVFAGGSAQATFRRSLTFNAWIRSEDTRASTTAFEQRGVSGVGRVEYRLRTINFALEYRHTNSRLQYGQAPMPTWYRGHQLRLSIIRHFGLAL